MKPKDVENVLTFYQTQVWRPGMKEELSEDDVDYLYRTLGFAKWMLANAMGEVKQAFRETLDQILKK